MMDEASRGSSPRRRRWLSGIGFVLLAWLFWHLGPGEIAAVVSRTDTQLFALAVLLYFPTILLRIWRWQMLVGCIGVRYRFVPACQGYLIGILIGLATPARVGEFARAVFLKNDCGVPLARGLPMVLADRLFDFLVILPFGALALASFGPVTASSAWIAVAGMVAVMALGLGIILHEPTINRLRLVVSSVVPGSRIGGKISELLLEMNQGFRQIRPGVLVMALVATMGAFGFFFIECFLITQSLGMQVSPLETTYAISLGTLVAMIPLSISGIGTRDASLIAYFSLHAVPSAAAMGFSLLWFVAFYGMSGVLGALAWGMRSLTFGRR